jgi:hypothetical protein
MTSDDQGRGASWAAGPPPPPKTSWPAPPPAPGPDDLKSPLWARVAILAGIGCSLVVLYLSTEFAIGQAEGDPPSVAMGYGAAELLFLVVGVPLLLVGLLRHFRAQFVQWPAAGPVAVLGGVGLWTLFTVGGPGLIWDVLT